MLNTAKKALVIDDCQLTAKMLGMLLKHQSYQVCYAHDGTSSLDILKKSEDYSLILMDLGLPDIHGIELVKKFRELEFLKSTKIIAITGRSDETEEYYLRAGFDIFLIKPCDLKQLAKLF